MSITIVAAPVLLYKMSTAIAVIATVATSKVLNLKKEENNNTVDISDLQINDKNSIIHIDNETILKMQEKEFETPFVDRDTLVKTLNEHGGEIEKEMIGYIKYKLENFTFEFYKENQEAECPYKLKIKYNNTDSLNNVLEDIQSEYITNVQEATYNKITKRLQEKNMSYEEEVYDDDSIVITVNLD